MPCYIIKPIKKNCIQETIIIKKYINGFPLEITREYLFKWGDFIINLNDDEYSKIDQNSDVFNLEDYNYELNYLDFSLDNYIFNTELELSDEQKQYYINNFEDLEDNMGFTVVDSFYEIFEGFHLKKI